MSILFYDTETTGLPLWQEPSNHPGQPHLVELAAVLTDDELSPLAQFSVIIEPDGWEIPADMAAIHGITTDTARKYGVRESLALTMFTGLWTMADLRVGHNEGFDARIMRISFMRHELEHVAEDFKAGAKFCTFNAARSALKGDQPKPDSFDLPSCVDFFCGGLKHLDAHRALPDAIACRRVYQALKERGAA